MRFSSAESGLKNETLHRDENELSERDKVSASRYGPDKLK